MKRVVWGCVALLAVAGAAGAAGTDTAQDAARDLAVLEAAFEADAPYRNALYLYLRVAGLAWIAVEWVAAIVLWRGYRHIRRVVEQAEGRADE